MVSARFKNIVRPLFRFLGDIYFGSRSYTVRKAKAFGFEFYVYADQHTSRKIVLGVFESAESVFLENYIAKDDACLDIGANMGYYTFLFASKAGTVTAIDPVHQNISLINLSLSTNNISNVKTICAAVGDVTGETSFLEMENSSLSSVSGLSFEGPIKDLYGSTAKTIYKVPVITIDSLSFNKLDVVKIDVEGYELKVLEGMRETIIKLEPRLFMVELVESHLARFSSSITDAIAFMHELGYKPYMLRDAKLLPYVSGGVVNDNIFFTR